MRYAAACVKVTHWSTYCLVLALHCRPRRGARQVAKCLSGVVMPDTQHWVSIQTLALTYGMSNCQIKTFVFIVDSIS